MRGYLIGMLLFVLPTAARAGGKLSAKTAATLKARPDLARFDKSLRSPEQHKAFDRVVRLGETRVANDVAESDRPGAARWTSVTSTRPPVARGGVVYSESASVGIRDDKTTASTLTLSRSTPDQTRVDHFIRTEKPHLGGLVRTRTDVHYRIEQSPSGASQMKPVTNRKQLIIGGLKIPLGRAVDKKTIDTYNQGAASK